MRTMLAISNIAWSADQDKDVYELMKKYGFSGLEIAPTRIFPVAPYEDLNAAAVWAEMLRNEYGFSVPSMQSIWYGRQEKVFGTDEERRSLIDYTKKAIDFAEAIGCKNLVFGCPRNRFLPDGADPQIAVAFFSELSEYAVNHKIVLGMEANPPIYNTNYINTTAQAMELVEKVNSAGFKINLDVGTMIENGESVSLLKGKTHLINHVHVSEPGLKKIQKRLLHEELSELLKKEKYQGYVSIEMGKREELPEIEEVCAYIREVFA